MSDLEGQGTRDHVSLDLGSLKLSNNRQPKGSLEELEAQPSAGGLPQLLEDGDDLGQDAPAICLALLKPPVVSSKVPKILGASLLLR